MNNSFTMCPGLGSLFLAIFVVLAATGCQPEHDHDHEEHGHGSHAGEEASGGHAHTPPHGGAPVLLGDHFYHLEFVLDAESGVLDAYCLDGHLEQFIRLPLESIEVTVASIDGSPTLSLLPVASTATGETVGDTSHFQAQSDALIGLEQFEAVLGKVEIGGQVFDQVAFKYPEGNE